MGCFFQATTQDSNTYFWGAPYPENLFTFTDAPIQQIDSVFDVSHFAVYSNGVAVAWGDFYYGGSGRPDEFSTISLDLAHIQRVSQYAFLWKTTNGVLSTWGYSGYHSIEINDNIKEILFNECTYTMIMQDESVAVAGSCYCGGCAVPYSLLRPAPGAEVVSIANTYFAFAALRADGSVVVWGDPSYGGANAPTSVIHPEPGFEIVGIVATGYDFFAITADRQLVGWGYYIDQASIDLHPFANSMVEALVTTDYNILVISNKFTLIPSEPTIGNDNATGVAALEQIFIVTTQSDLAIVWGGSCAQMSFKASEVVQIVYINYLCSVLFTNGSVGAWGYNLNYRVVQSSAVRIFGTNFFSAGLLKSGSVAVWQFYESDTSWFCYYRNDANFSPNCDIVPPLQYMGSVKVVDIVPVYDGAFAALMSDGTITTWGLKAPAIPSFVRGITKIWRTSFICFSALAENFHTIYMWCNIGYKYKMTSHPLPYSVQVAPNFLLITTRGNLQTTTKELNLYRDDATFVIPINTTSVRVYMWGAGGAGDAGGNGAYVEGTLDVTPGQELMVIVGGRGNLRAESVGGGGIGGGGRSAIQFEGRDLVTAGGGGSGHDGASASAYNEKARSSRKLREPFATICIGGSADSTARGENCCGNMLLDKVDIHQGGTCVEGAGGGGGYFGGGGGGFRGCGGAGSSYLNNLRDSSQSEHASEQPGLCAGIQSKYFSMCYLSCGAGGTSRLDSMDGCVVIELLGSDDEGSSPTSYCALNHCSVSVESAYGVSGTTRLVSTPPGALAQMHRERGRHNDRLQRAAKNAHTSRNLHTARNIR